MAAGLYASVLKLHASFPSIARCFAGACRPVSVPPLSEFRHSVGVDRIEREQVQMSTVGEVALMLELMVELGVERIVAPAVPGPGRC